MLNSAPRVLVFLAFATLILPAHATPEKDAQWKKLIAQAIEHGGVETLSGQTGSYVFAGPDAMDVTFTRRLDDKIRLVCAGNMSANINVCWNWDTEACTYSIRADANAAWVVSRAPPDASQPAETRHWWPLLAGICGVKASSADIRKALQPKEPAFSKQLLRIILGDNMLGLIGNH